MNDAVQKVLPWTLGLVAVIVVMSLARTFNMPLPLLNSMPYGQLGSDVARSAIEPMMGVPEDSVGGGYGGVAMTKSLIAPVPPYYAPGDDLGNPERSIVRSGSLEVLVGDVSAAVTATSEYIKSVKGMVLQSSMNTYRDTVTGSMSLRVPEAQFDTVIAWLQKQGRKVESLSVYSYDQTGQVTNTENQLQRLKDQLADYEAQLPNLTAAEKIKIQRQIDSLKEQIASWEQQSENLEEQSAMSQISVTYTKKAFALPVFGSLDIGVVLQQAIDALVAMAQMIFTLVIWAVVFVPIWLPTVLITKKLTGPKTLK